LDNKVFSFVLKEVEVLEQTKIIFFQDDSTPKLSEELARPLKMMQDSARRIAKVSVEAKLNIEEDNYVQSFRPNLMDVVHAWSSVRRPCMAIHM